MPWTPTQSVINSRAIAENLLTFFATNQADAILWANGSAIRPIAQFSTSIANRSNPVFPAISVATTNDAQDYGEDIRNAAFFVTFEVMVESQTPLTAVTEAKVYDRAIKSMIANIPDADLAADSGAIVDTIVLATIESTFSEIQTNAAQNDFLQVCQIKAGFTLKASAYE